MGYDPSFLKPHCFRDWCCFDSCLLYWITV